MNFSARTLATAAALSTLLAAGTLSAQDSGDGFRFSRPSGSLSLRGGFAMPNANSDLFSFTTSNLTINRGDFSALDLGGSLAFSLSPRIDLVFDVAHSGMDKGSEFRNFIDNSGNPIQQSTSFSRTPVTVNVKYYLTDRGRQIGRYAWIPNRAAPYIGVGVGAMYYDFSQNGDFIDDSTRAVFPDQFSSHGWAPMAQAMAGVEWSLSPGWALVTEARYLGANASPGSDYQGFHRIDLSGLTTSAGFILRF